MLALIVAFGSHGDILPLIALGAELKRRGHDVVLAGAEPFAAAADRAGVEFECLVSAEDYQRAASQPDLWRPIAGVRRLFGFVGEGVRPTFDFIARRRVKRDTMVIASSLALGARLAHDVLKTPLITVHLAPLQIQSRHEAPVLPLLPRFDWLPEKLRWRLQLGVDEQIIDPVALPKLNELRAELGVAPVGRIRNWWNAPRRVLLMCPDWFVAPQPDWPPQVRQFAFPEADRFGSATGPADPALDRFLAGGKDVVAVTFGSAMREHARLYRASVEACLRLGLRCLVMAPIELDLPPGAAERVHVARYAPLGTVLEHCVAAIHHGGVGTIGRAFAAGVPQLIVPIAFDHFDNAARVRRLGCGVVMNRFAFGPRRGAAALGRLIASPDVAAACRRTAGLCEGADGVADACDEIEAEFAAVQARRRRKAAAVAAA